MTAALLCLTDVQKIDESEALFYLEQADWSLDSAVQQYKEDCQWELDHSGLDKA